MPATKDQNRHLTVSELTRFIAEGMASGKAVRRLLVEQYLFLEVRNRTGAVSWVFRYSFAGVKSSQGFGKFPGVGLAEAREKARHSRELLSKGVNPVEAKRAGLQGAKLRHERTVMFAVEQWLAANKKTLTSGKYAAQKERRLREVLGYSDPRLKVRALGGIAVATATTENVTDSLGVLTGREVNETARRVLSDLGKAFDWARGKGWRAEANPCSGVKVTIERVAQVGHRSPELVDLGGVVRGIRSVMDTGAGDFDYDTRLALLLLLTGARTSEIRLARWDEVVDLDGPAPRIDVPASRMKKRKGWTIPLSSQAVALVRELRDNAAIHENASPLIFFKYKHGGWGVVCNENTVNNVLRKAGLHDKVVGHGFRKLLSTAAYSLWPYRGNNRERAIEHSLAHVNSQTVEETYNRSAFLPERLLLLQWWADHLDRVAAGTDDGNVIEFKRA